jgi:hypothetical protein
MDRFGKDPDDLTDSESRLLERAMALELAYPRPRL